MNSSHRNRLQAAAVVALVLLLSGVGSVAAQSGSKPATEQVDAEQVDAEQVDVEQVTPEREAAALTFAKRHHPELAEILAPLKNMDQAGYEKAIQELFKTSELLAKLQSRAPERYETELELWKIDSRIRLLVARSAMKDSMKDSDELRVQIKTLLVRRNEIRLGQYQAEREKLQSRMTKLEATIQNLQENSPSLAEKEMDRLLKSVKPSRQKSSEPAAAKGVGGNSPTTPVKKTPDTKQTVN